MNTSTFLTQFFLLFCLAITPLLGYAEEPTQTETSLTTSGKIDINTADAQLLASTLKGVGLAKAQAIVDYREEFGPFHTIHELEDVTGIGKSILTKNMHLIATNP